ncbi:MAG: hypothetical protein ACXVZ2_11935 [Gaiellaceae bacterium]
MICFACAALALAGSARSGLTVGVSEDRGKDTSATAAQFFQTLGDVGLTQNRVSIIWNPAQPTSIPQEQEIKNWLPLAQSAGVTIVFAVSAHNAHDFSSSSGAITQFAAFLQTVAQAFPTVKNYVIGNEPNQPYFWLPQYDTNGKPLSAAAYEPVLAQSYDALKAVDATINVIGIGLSPRGNDNPFATSNVSRSPVRFLHDLGVAYRKSGRTKPLMDQLAFHPYPAHNTDLPQTGYTWPNAGLPNLDRIKQAVWDAFNGTAQPIFKETGKTPFSPPLQLDLDELGWQVAPLPQLAGLYTGVENVPTIDEATQATDYAESIQSAECDPTVASLNFFLLADEPELTRWQSGLERIDGSKRPSYDAVKQVIHDSGGTCQTGVETTWKHFGGVVYPLVTWGDLKQARPARNTKWAFKAGAQEEALFRAAVFTATTSKEQILKVLQRGQPKALLVARGTIKAKTRVVVLPKRRLKAGRYVFAIRMQATMNPARTTLVVSRPFRVR